ncbi:DUF6185 family protein [Streptomyces sp. NPDC101776]|uniref:DUF6185 family protein n=1 Tax=Streptomyces sp. NPDC101776 TaxID=3366146 RepID=UPI00381C5EC2
MCAVASSTSARAAEAAGDACASAGLAGAQVSTSVRLQHDDRTYTKITTELSVDVPSRWAHAKDLLLSEDSGAYTTAMACLTRHQPGQQRRWAELRSGPPVVSSKHGRIRVVDKAYSWVSQYRSYIDVGMWRVRAGARSWTVQLQPPSALAGAHWDEITVDPGSPGAEDAKPRPTERTGDSTLVWRPARSAPAVTVSVRPPWQRSWAAQSDRLVAVGLDRLGALLWVATMSVLLLVAVLLYRRRPSAPSGTQRRTLRNLAAWAPAAVVLFLLTHADDLILRYEERHDLAWSWPDQHILLGDAFALGAVAVLFSFARPSWRFWAAGALLAVPPVATMTMPELFGLRPSPWADTYEASGGALAAQTTASCCLMALTLLGCVAVAWRLAVDGGLLPQSRRFPGRDRVLRLRLAAPAVLVWTVLTAVCFAVVEERNWQRATWLSNRGSRAYGTDHGLDTLREAVQSVSDGQELIIDHTWILTGFAVLAVLRTWRATPTAPSVPSSTSPLNDWADRLLLLAFFPLAVGLDDGHYVDNGLVQVIWIPLYLLTLYGAVAIPSRRAVLAQPLEVSGRPLATVAGPSARSTLLKKSRNYRETHAILRRLDQGLLDDSRPERKNLEAELDRLHDWPVSGSLVGDRLPANVSVVDASLALGPRDDWWANGVRGARFALIPGLPAAALGSWADWIRGAAWQDTLSNGFALPSLALAVLWWLATWVGGGFLLGALWRVLPGRRGAVKALPVALAFALPVGLDGLGGWFTQEGFANLALYTSTMLLVLTITGIALDLDTFSGERRYWQSRLGLLLSVYQMRYYSLQVAYLIAQVIAVISIWQFFAEPTVMPAAGGK